MAILVMIIAGFTATVVLALTMASTAALQTHRVAHALRQDIVEATSQQVMGEDMLTWMDNGALPASNQQALRVRDERLADLFDWGTSMEMSTVSRGEPIEALFAKGVLLSAKPGGNPTHPMESLSGASRAISYSLDLSDSYLGSITLPASLTLRETPACDVAFISAGVFQPTVASIPLTVVGVAYLPYGAGAAAEPGKLTADRLVSSSLPPALNGASAKRHVNSLYRGSWGTPSLADIASPVNLGGTAAPQSYFNGVDRTISIQEAGMMGAPIAGVAYRAFPDGGPRRLVVTLAALPPSVVRLYINCESPDTRTNGIVIIGDPSLAPGVTRTIGTNGNVWLWGDNNQPVAIGTIAGQWTLTDNAWAEDSTGGLPPLNLAWAGHLFSPVSTVFSTPQSDPGARLNLNGSLTAGTCTGDLTAMTITQQEGSPLRQLVERIAYLYHFN